MTQTSIRRAVPVLALSALLSACAMTFDARSLGLPAAMANAAAAPVVGDTFAVTERAVHAFWGLYPVKMPNLQNALAGQLAGGGGVQNLRIRTRKTLADIFVTVLTAGIVSPTAVTFEGVITPRTP